MQQKESLKTPGFMFPAGLDTDGIRSTQATTVLLDRLLVAEPGITVGGDYDTQHCFISSFSSFSSSGAFHMEMQMTSYILYNCNNKPQPPWLTVLIVHPTPFRDSNNHFNKPCRVSQNHYTHHRLTQFRWSIFWRALLIAPSRLLPTVSPTADPYPTGIALARPYRGFV